MRGKIIIFATILCIISIMSSGCVSAPQGGTPTPLPTAVPTPPPASGIPVELRCAYDSDCSCGVSIATGVCAFGNRDYIDASKQCPDFCTGIAGNFRTACVGGACTHVSSLPR